MTDTTEQTYTFAPQEFLDWLRSQDEYATLNMMDGQHCALAQFVKSKGWPLGHAGFYSWRDTGHDVHVVPSVVHMTLAMAPEHISFGRLASRLADCLATQEV